MVAAWRGALRALKALLEGSDLDLSDKDKRTGSTSDIFHPALLSSSGPTHNHSVTTTMLCLVTAPGPVCSFSLGLFAVFHWAALSKEPVEVFQLLCGRNCETNGKDKLGDTCLHKMVLRGDVKSCQILTRV